MCAVVATDLGIEYKINNINAKLLQKSLKNQQKRAKKVCEDLKRDPSLPFSFEDVNISNNYYKNKLQKEFRIVVVDVVGKLLYDTNLYEKGNDDEIRIYLLHMEDHYHLVNNIQ